MQKIRTVLFFSANPSIRIDDGSGAGSHIRGVVSALRSLGISVISLIGTPTPGHMPSTRIEVGQSNLNQGRLPRSFLRTRAPVFWSTVRSVVALRREFRNVKAFSSALKSQKPDLVYERLSNWQWTSTSKSMKLGIPHVIEVNSIPGIETAYIHPIVHKFQLRVTHKKLRYASYLIAVSRELRDEILRSFANIPPVYVVPNAAPDVVLHKRSNNLEVVNILFAGSMRAWHGLDILLESISTLEFDIRRQVHFYFAGIGPDLQRIVAQASELRLEECTSFVGHLQQEELTELYAKCSVGILPSNASYGSPTKLLEYAAHGLAVIAPDIPAVRDVFSDEKNALLVQPNAESITAAITKVLDPVLRNGLAEEAVKLATGRSWENAVTQILNYLPSENEPNL